MLTIDFTFVRCVARIDAEVTQTALLSVAAMDDDFLPVGVCCSKPTETCVCMMRVRM